jgi:hypothetical protein
VFSLPSLHIKYCVLSSCHYALASQALAVKYTIPGRVYAEMPELLEELSNAELKQRLSAVGQKVGGKKAELVERLRDYMAEK